MTENRDIDILIDQIRETIKGHSSGALPSDKARTAYRILLSRYKKLEGKYISENSRGSVKGLLHHHNTSNNANLTAIFLLENSTPAPLAHVGDSILMDALPDIILKERKTIESGVSARVKLGNREDQSFSLVLKKISAERDTIVAAAVTSSPLFNINDFEFLAEFLKTLYLRNRELFSPVMLNYMNDISAEISRIFNTGKDGAVYADHFFLFKSTGAFEREGVYNIIDFSNFIIGKLKETYPPRVHIFALSISDYIVLYDETTKQGLDIKRNKIDFLYHGNNIPYKVIMTGIKTPQDLYLFLEKL
jgi:hypothetical protein